jgi:hypothetical protein
MNWDRLKYLGWAAAIILLLTITIPLAAWKLADIAAWIIDHL